MSACGSCTMCCKLLKIDDEGLKKPAHKWCDHCDKGRGCSIYEARPKSCRDYECAWLQSQTYKSPMPVEMRPDRCKVLINPGKESHVLIFVVDPGYPDAWRTGLLKQVFYGAMSNGMTVVVDVGPKRRVFSKGREKTFVERQVEDGAVTQIEVRD